MEDSRGFQILLVGNYRIDRQMSMLRYQDLLLNELRKRNVHVEVIEPGAFLGKIPAGPLTKWLRYIDKYLLFPPVLRRRVKALNREAAQAERKLVVHITDHSNAIYLTTIGAVSVVATCHDLLAVRGALGEDTDCPASRFGKILQAKILAGLSRAQLVICVSSATRGDLARLAPGTNVTVIPLPLNQKYSVLTKSEIVERLPAGLAETLYILHVGSSLRRKNREGILRVFGRIADRFEGKLVFAGELLNSGQRLLAEQLGVSGRILEIESPSGSVLEALYNGAYGFLFPSRTEGFGWPVIEAQACGCPVVAARTTSLPEVVGEGGLLRDLDDEAGFAEAVLSLQSPNVRKEITEKGFANVTRFATPEIMECYLKAYAALST